MYLKMCLYIIKVVKDLIIAWSRCLSRIWCWFVWGFCQNQSCNRRCDRRIGDVDWDRSLFCVGVSFISGQILRIRCYCFVKDLAFHYWCCEVVDLVGVNFLSGLNLGIQSYCFFKDRAFHSWCYEVVDLLSWICRGASGLLLLHLWFGGGRGRRWRRPGGVTGRRGSSWWGRVLLSLLLWHEERQSRCRNRLRVPTTWKSPEMCGEGAHGEVATFQPRRESVATAVDRQLVNKILDDYFYRQGLFEAGDCLVK